MANMSYCRFQNTLADLRECHRALLEMRAWAVNDGDGEVDIEDRLSPAEMEAARDLLTLVSAIEAAEFHTDVVEPGCPPLQS